MNLMKLAIILDPLESIKTYKDSTYAVMRAAPMLIYMFLPLFHFGRGLRVLPVAESTQPGRYLKSLVGNLWY